MLQGEEINEWGDPFEVADRIVEQKERGVHFDEWGTHADMLKFVDAYKTMMKVCVDLMEQNEALIRRVSDNGNDTKTETGV
jgi:hypothetical protein